MRRYGAGRVMCGAVRPLFKVNSDQRIAADPDTHEVSVREMARMRPLRGRPRVERPKESVTMRLDAEVLDALKASSPGWQTRVNDLLKQAVRRGRI
jgi:uncharacterized protein (DUF4415 family)